MGLIPPRSTDIVRARHSPPKLLGLVVPERFTPRGRAILVAGGAFLAGLLIVARLLPPDPRGFGTHERLAFCSPCGFRAMTGWPCPTCGMTTSWSHYTRGEFGRALRANPGGLLLAMLATVVAPWSLLSGIRGRWVPVPPSTWGALAAVAAVVLASMAGWLSQLNGI
jgi:hypothetical protein